jgi:hypothetical protein
MKDGFARCHTYEYLEDSSCVVLGMRRRDEELAHWWDDFNTFLCGCILSPHHKVSYTKPMKAVKQSPRIEAMSILSHAKEAIAVVSMQPVSVAMTKFSEEKQPDVAKVVMCVETAVEKVKPLSGLNMQLKWVHDEACIAVDKGQRWSLFQTQCMVKFKACKLMVDGGSYCNGISKAVVMTVGLSTWRIPEPKHVAWLNSCSMLKVTHKVHVPFTVGDYVDEVECDVLPLEVYGLLLGRPWPYDRNVTHAGRANNLLCMMATSGL